MVHCAGFKRNAIALSMKSLFLFVVITISRLVSATVPDEPISQSNEKETPLTPALRYRRFRILQVEDPPTLYDENFELSGTITSSKHGTLEGKNSVLHVDKSFWGRLLQADGSMSMSMPPVPTPPVKPTAAPESKAPVMPAPSQPPILATTAPSIVAPTCSSANRSDTVLSLLEEITPELGNISSSSPQNMALNWILDIDVTDPCAHPDSILQRYAIVTLYYSTRGESWFNSTGWLSVESECSWYGVSCTSGSDDVERFELAQNNLGGTLPSELIAFSKLQSFDVYSNIIGGTIPTALETLTDLSLIDMEENLLTGSAFLDISSLRELSSYRVSLNSLSGTIPGAFNPGASSSLHELWFARNSIEGSIPESLFLQNTEIQSFIAYGNDLSGALPSSIGQLKSLVKLQLHDNAFISTIPNELFGATALQELRLDKNLLEGTVSTLLGDLVNLVDLRIGENQFSGTLPAEIAKLSNLAILLVNATKLTGAIRDAFEPLRSLRFADFSKNLFSGPLPESIFESGSIEFLYFSENALTGSIPPNYGNASNLSDLYINNNKLVGTVPPILPGQLPKLTEFLLFSNSLTGTMPASICLLRGDDKENDLTELVADCGGQTPLIQCDCCNGCITPP